MTTVPSMLNFRRRAFVGAAALSVAAAGLAAGATPSSAGVQTVGFTVGTSGPAFTSTSIRADFTLTNPSANTGAVAAFSIVVPPGVGVVRGAGVTGPGNWRESVLACGSVARCSSVVLVYATLPLSTSVLRPGNSLTSSIAFTTPARTGPIVFRMIGIGNGIFTTTDTPTINVISGDAAAFALNDPALATATPSNSTVAGQSQVFTLQAQNTGGSNVPYGPAQVRVELGADDPHPATLQLGVGNPPVYGSTFPFASLPNPVSGETKYAVLLPVPASASGLYNLKITFFTAASPTSVSVNDIVKPAVNGNLSGFSVLASTPTAVVLDSIKDGSTTPPLPRPVAGKSLVASFHLTDAYNNPTTLHASSVALGAPGPGTLGTQSVVDSNPGANPPTLGTVTTSYSVPTQPIGFTLTLSNPTATSSPFQSGIDGSGQTALLTPFVSGGFSTPACALSPTDPVCSTANLPNGADGQVNLIQQLCDSTDNIPVCATNPSQPVITSVLGDFTDGKGGNLYTRSAPASMTIVCLAAVCHDPDGDSLSDSDTAEEIAEIIAAYPGHAKTSLVPVEGPGPVWEQLAPCLTPIEGSPVIPSTTQYCSDHSSYSFDEAGNLSFTIYYLTDPKGGP